MSNNELSLHNKVILVTGASSGIGEATCHRLALAGAHVIVHYHNDQKNADEIVHQIKQTGIGDALALQADVTKEEEIVQLFDQAASAFGKLYGLVCYASTERVEPLLELSAEGIDAVLGVNLRGTLLCVREAGKRLVDHGRILLTSSVVAERPLPQDPVFGATKLATDHITKSAALTLMDRGITVNCLRPGAISSGNSRVDRAPKEVQEMLNSFDGDPMEIAHVAHFLLSEEGKRVNGQSIAIDAGLLLGCV